MKVTVDGIPFSVTVSKDSVSIDGKAFKVETSSSGSLHTVLVDGRSFKVDLAHGSGEVVVDGKAYRAALTGSAAAPMRGATSRPPRAEVRAGGIKALMPGRVSAVRVKEGDTVAAGAVLLILEAMEMANEICAPSPGIVTSIRVAVGSSVNKGDPLLVVE
jgi:biotin carboxyl carrier protein